MVTDGTNHSVDALLHFILGKTHGPSNVATSLLIDLVGVLALVDECFKTALTNAHCLLASLLRLLHAVLAKLVNATQTLHVTLKRLTLLLAGACHVLVIKHVRF